MVSENIFTNISDIENLSGFAQELVDCASPRDDQACVITLSGDLGAGKTTLTQEIGKVFNINEDINSPTYVIEQRYDIPADEKFSELVHIDAYRLEQEGDPQKIGLDRTLTDPSKIVIIEWPQKIGNFLDSYRKIAVNLTQNDKGRQAQITENSL